MSKSELFGKDLRLVDQVIMLANKLGGDEVFWKIMAHDKEFLAYIIDFAAFHLSPAFPVFDGKKQPVEIHLACFSQNSPISNTEANLRVEHFGRYATEQEFSQLFEQLKDDTGCPKFDLQNSITTHSLISPDKSKPYRFWRISCRGLWGKLDLSEYVSGPCYEDKGITWEPNTIFAVVPREKPNWKLFWSRKGN